MQKLILSLLPCILIIVSTQSFYAQIRQRRVTETPGVSSVDPTKEQKEDQPESVGQDDVVRINTTLVTVPVSVMDRNGKYIPNLRQSDFHIFEEGVEQPIAYFASTEQPFTVVLMIDASRSTRFKLEDIQDAAIAFTNQLRPSDQVMVVSFAESIRTHTEPTNNRNDLIRAIRNIRVGGGTSLYDAVHLVINHHLKRVPGRKAVVLFTDGVDTTSRNGTYASNIHDAEECDALIYPIQYDTYSDNRQDNGWPRRDPSIIIPRWPFPFPFPRRGPFRSGNENSIILNAAQTGRSREEYSRANKYLRELAEKTGARIQKAEALRNVEDAFRLIAEELRRQYSIGYYPTSPAQAGQRRKIKVKVNQPNLVIRARDSYIST
jgi:VWFA-related protein